MHGERVFILVCVCVIYIMGKMLEKRETRVRSLTALGVRLMVEESLTPEQLENSIRRYILCHYGGSPYTIQGYLTETMAKVEYELEKITRAKMV